MYGRFYFQQKKRHQHFTRAAVPSPDRAGAYSPGQPLYFAISFPFASMPGFLCSISPYICLQVYHSAAVSFSSCWPPLVAKALLPPRRRSIAFRGHSIFLEKPNKMADTPRIPSQTSHRLDEIYIDIDIARRPFRHRAATHAYYAAIFF